MSVRAAVPLIAFVVLPASAQAQVLALTVGISTECPYGPVA